MAYSIDALEIPERPVERPFRMTISDVFKGTVGGLSISGKVDTGFVQAGDQVLVMPPGELVLIKSRFLLGKMESTCRSDFLEFTQCSSDQS